MNFILSALMSMDMLVSMYEADSLKPKYFKGSNLFFNANIEQINDSLNFNITNLTTDTMVYYVGFFAQFDDSSIARYDYNIFHNKRPLGGKFATFNYKILPGESINIKKRVAPEMFNYITFFKSYRWFVGSYDRKNKAFIFLKLE